MKLWRISDFTDLSGDGGLLGSARWHSLGRRIVYLADHPASALIEAIVHLEIDADDLPNDYQLLAVEVSNEVAFETVEMSDLPPDWQKTPDVTRRLGDRWLEENRSALMRVPSAVVPFASNWLLNPSHPEGTKVRIAQIIRAPFDFRLFG